MSKWRRRKRRRRRGSSNNNGGDWGLVRWVRTARPPPPFPPPKRQGGGGSCSPLFCTYELLGNKQLRGKLTQERRGRGRTRGSLLERKKRKEDRRDELPPCFYVTSALSSGLNVVGSTFRQRRRPLYENMPKPSWVGRGRVP